MTAARKKPSPLDAALALQQRGDLDGAEVGFRKVIEEDPENPDGLVLLGMLLQKTKRAEEAVPLIERAIAVAPQRSRTPDPAWRVALSLARRDAGDAEGALTELDSLIAGGVSSPELDFFRAGILQRLDRHDEAIAAYEGFLGGAPDHAQALNNLAISLKATGRLKEAFDTFKKVVDRRPNYVQALVNVGNLLVDMAQMQVAIPYLQRACTLEPENRTAEAALIDALEVGGRVDEANRLADRALESEPDSPQAMIQAGNIAMVLGQRDRAVALARRALDVAPGAPGGLALLAEADREADAATLLAEIEDVLTGAQSFGIRTSLHFAAARLCEKLQRYEEAFAHYAGGNSARREQLERLGKGYEPGRVEGRVDTIIDAFGAGSLSEAGGSPSEVPLFIVGMPRSGTTLTEQILASHPNVVGGGELGEVGEIDASLRGVSGYPAALAQGRVRECATRYLTHVGKIGRGAARVTDKMPGNFTHLGLIVRMFPNARIVHCRRDPMDNCLSCFAQNFRADGLSWSTDLRDLGHYYCQYRRLMAHWRAILPPARLLEIDYEETVADLEGQARRLVAFAGLEWDDACLKFHKTERAVVTASREQVRNPIYKSSVGRWRRYGDGVAPLAEALASCGCGPDAEPGGTAA